MARILQFPSGNTSGNTAVASGPTAAPQEPIASPPQSCAVEADAENSRRQFLERQLREIAEREAAEREVAEKEFEERKAAAVRKLIADPWLRRQLGVKRPEEIMCMTDAEKSAYYYDLGMRALTITKDKGATQ